MLSIDPRRPAYVVNLCHKIADPSDCRTLKQFALDENIDYGALISYKMHHDAEIYAEADRLRTQYIPKLREVAYEALFRRATKSDNALKLIFQLAGDLVERSEVAYKHLTPEEKRQKIADLVASLSAKLESKKPKDQLNAELPKQTI